MDRILETIEKLYEQITEQTPSCRPFRVVLDIGDAIEIPAQRKGRTADSFSMDEIKQRVQAMLNQLGAESPLYRSQPKGNHE